MACCQLTAVRVAVRFRPGVTKLKQQALEYGQATLTLLAGARSKQQRAQAVRGVHRSLCSTGSGAAGVLVTAGSLGRVHCGQLRAADSRTAGASIVTSNGSQ